MIETQSGTAGASFIRVYHDAIPRDLRVELMSLTASHRIDEAWRSCGTSYVRDDLFGRLVAALRPAIDRYGEIAPTTKSCHDIELPMVVRYEPVWDHFHEHADAWNAATATRQVAIVGYLNDVGLGGETEFPAFDVRVRPEAGTVLFFPSSFVFSHLAHPPISGPKFAVVTWLHFRKRLAIDAGGPTTMPFER